MKTNQLFINRNHVIVGLLGVTTSFFALSYTEFNNVQKLSMFFSLFILGFSLSFIGFRSDFIRNPKWANTITKALSVFVTLLVGLIITYMNTTK